MNSLRDLHYETDHLTVDQDLVKDILLLSSYYPNTGVQKSNAGGWQSVSHLYEYGDSEDPMRGLANKVRSLYLHMTQDMKLHDHVEPTLNMNFFYWFNVNRSNDLNYPHDHMPQGEDGVWTMLSGVYYLKKPPNCGNIVIQSDRGYYQNWFAEQFDTVIEAKEGDIIVFPPHIMHYVQPNISTEPRVSVAFNLTIAKV